MKMPPGVQNPLLHTEGAGMSAYQQNLVLPSRIGTAAGAMELQSRTQQAAGMLGEARNAVVAGNTATHQVRTVEQNAQAEMAQALVARAKEDVIHKCGLSCGKLAEFGQMALGGY